MNASERIAEILADHLTAANAITGLGDRLELATALCVRCLLDEHRLLICGSGGSMANAQQLALKLLGRLERERPGLPALCLSGGTAVATALAESHGSADMFARQVRALGQSGDVLIALSTNGMTASTVQAVVAAHDRRMNVVALTGADGGDLASVLAPNDVEIRIPSSSGPRTGEIHLLAINLLCELIERELFGEVP